MNISLNEVEATAKRATRGAGYSWGLAEEAAKATRWLCARGQNGTGALARLLQMVMADAPKQRAPTDLSGDWHSDELLCPLVTGALLSDCAIRVNSSAITMSNVAVPVLLLPFAANAARLLDTRVTIECDGIIAETDGLDLTLNGPIPDQAKHVSVHLGGRLANAVPHHTRAEPSPTDWSTLNRFAQNTYAPATEESRLRGAGAGLSDND
ncbi:DUF3726 domain-containing protein [Ruegeria sp. Ofav3-42]|uniref:DUF3726 domain-containing protein n=1 Tax=Ruegeria sp. Ofav3-42 TaxID=2917759 RepID=UPI001EF43C06|nr:DUF3726 domain-containing protein [Ruegeria sp. Ofav3-42]MCG7520810.1 DUF3726 domain-containing protein [Ruegeria sp. Ofav3-42]